MPARAVGARDEWLAARKQLMGTYQYLDLAPMGRNEEVLEPPAAWRRRASRGQVAYRD